MVCRSIVVPGASNSSIAYFSTSTTTTSIPHISLKYNSHAQNENARHFLDMIDDANNRFNDKIDGMEGYVKRELTNLERELNNKLTKALDNPLANR